MAGVVLLDQGSRLFFVEIFGGNIVFRHFMGFDFPLVGIRGILHAFDDFGFKRIALFEQLAHTFRIGTFNVRQSLKIAGLSAGTSAQPLRFKIGDGDVPTFAASGQAASQNS